MTDLVDRIRANNTWKLRAACREMGDPSWFLTDERGHYGAPPAQAYAICSVCVVRAVCLAEALANRDYGIWGGTSENERKRIRAAQQTAA